MGNLVPGTNAAYSVDSRHSVSILFFFFFILKEVALLNGGQYGTGINVSLDLVDTEQEVSNLHA